MSIEATKEALKKENEHEVKEEEQSQQRLIEDALKDSHSFGSKGDAWDDDNECFHASIERKEEDACLAEMKK